MYLQICMESGLLLAGTIYGFILSAAILVKNPSPKQANFWLGIFILSFTSILFDNWGIRVELQKYIPWFDWTFYRTVSIIPLSFWMYIKKSTAQQIKYNLDKKIGWMFVIVELTILGSIFLSQGELMNQYLVTKGSFFDILGILLTILLYPAIVWALSSYPALDKKEKSESVDWKNVHWLRQLLVLITILTFVWISTVGLNLIFGYTIVPHSFLYMLMCVVVFFVGMKGYLQPDLILHVKLPAYSSEVVSTLQDSSEAVHQGKKEEKLSTKEQLIISDLSHLIEQKKLYRQPKLSIQDVSKELHQSPKFLSSLINRYFEKNFNEYVNTFRIQEVKDRLNKGHHLTHSITSIAFDAGFNSKSSFYATFKKYTGQTPSEFTQT